MYVKKKLIRKVVQVKIGAASTWFISSPLYIPDPPPMMPQISKTQALKKKKKQDVASLMTALFLNWCCVRKNTTT
jgi:hypothetical protein